MYLVSGMLSWLYLIILHVRNSRYLLTEITSPRISWRGYYELQDNCSCLLKCKRSLLSWSLREGVLYCRTFYLRDIVYCQQPVNITHDYTSCCLYRVDPPDDEQQAYSKHVEAYYWNKLVENSVSCWFMLYGNIFFNVLLTVHLSITFVNDQLDAQCFVL